MTDNPPPDRLDYIIVPSYTLRSAQRPTSQTSAALDLAYTTYTTHLPTNPDLKIILSTGDNQSLGVSNARVMADYLIDKGIPERALILEEKSRDTFENLRESRKIIESRTSTPTRATPTRTSTLTRSTTTQTPRLVIVAYDLHMRRILLLAGMLGWQGFHWLSARGEAESAYGWRALQTSSRSAIWVYEKLAYLYEHVRNVFR